MSQLKKFLVCFGCNGSDYLTRVSAVSLAGAEHIILDLSVCGKHSYGVSYAQAFDAEGIKTDTFVSMALSASTISLDDARKTIESYNAIIRMQDARENRISEIESEMQSLQDELSALRSAPGIPF